MTRLAVLSAPLLALLGCASAGDPPPPAPQPAAPESSPPAAMPEPGAPPESPTVPVAPPITEPVSTGPPIRSWTDYEADRSLGARARVALSAQRRPTVEALFSDAGVAYPPKTALFRVFKQERELELWADGPDGKLVRVATYGVCAMSGELGPKRREGDFQVPEGFYTVDLFKPNSDYHLSMRVSYPNRSDRVLGDPRHPGSAIMIHGACASIGCVAMSDERIEELWQIGTALRDKQRTLHVHILPSRDLDALIAANTHPQHAAFWRNLGEGDAIFRVERRAPVISVAADGRYQFR